MTRQELLELLELEVKAVKLAKAEKAFARGVATYGSVPAALKAYDCKTRVEAVKMLATVQPVQIYKVAGMVIVE